MAFAASALGQEEKHRMRAFDQMPEYGGGKPKDMKLHRVRSPQDRLGCQIDVPAAVRLLIEARRAVYDRGYT